MLGDRSWANITDDCGLQQQRCIPWKEWPPPPDTGAHAARCHSAARSSAQRGAPAHLWLSDRLYALIQLRSKVRMGTSHLIPILIRACPFRNMFIEAAGAVECVFNYGATFTVVRWMRIGLRGPQFYRAGKQAPDPLDKCPNNTYISAEVELSGNPMEDFKK